MTAPQLPEARLREIVEIPKQGYTVSFDYSEVLAMAAELLAARETIDDLQVSNSSLIAEALKNDTLRQERDAARAELEELRTEWFGIAGGENSFPSDRGGDAIAQQQVGAWLADAQIARAEVERLKAELVQPDAEARELLEEAAGLIGEIDARRKAKQPALLTQPHPSGKEHPAAPDSLPSPETRSPSGRMCGSREHQAPQPIPPEIRHLGPVVAAKLMASQQNPAPTEGPSDGEILAAINKVEWVGTIGDFARAIRMVAQRAGVRL